MYLEPTYEPLKKPPNEGIVGLRVQVYLGGLISKYYEPPSIIPHCAGQLGDARGKASARAALVYERRGEAQPPPLGPQPQQAPRARGPRGPRGPPSPTTLPGAAQLKLQCAEGPSFSGLQLGCFFFSGVIVIGECGVLP